MRETQKFQWPGSGEGAEVPRSWGLAGLVPEGAWTSCWGKGRGRRKLEPSLGTQALEAVTFVSSFYHEDIGAGRDHFEIVSKHHFGISL